MEFTGLGTAVMFALAAVLWFAYLLPTWFRRREYLATERNATRLQQTLRIMAETAEVPDEVRVEATARDAAAQARILAEKRRVDEARERAALAAVRRAAAPVLSAAERARRRLRRARRAAAISLLLAIAVAGVQGGVMATAGATATAWAVLSGATVLGLVSMSGLRGLSRRRIAAPAASSSGSVAATRRRAVAEPVVPAVAAEPVRSWTPVPVPKPLYLDRPAPQPVQPPRDADRLMREASAAAQAALRAAHGEAEVVALPTRPAPVATPATNPAATTPAATTPAARVPAEPSRWARMGMVGDVETAAPDLDDILRRRRAAG